VKSTESNLFSSKHYVTSQSRLSRNSPMFHKITWRIRTRKFKKILQNA